MVWAKLDFNESDWDSLMVTCFWEHQGYLDLDGFAWYRKNLVINRSLETESLVLATGKINDVDEVYFNGVFISRTGFITPLKAEIPGINTWRMERFYEIPTKLIHWDRQNVIAIRIYDYLRIGSIWYSHLGLTTKKAYARYLKTNKR